MFRLGYLQRTCDLILATVMARPTAALTTTEEPSGQVLWHRIRGWAADALLISKIIQLWRSGPWNMLGWLVFFAGKWFGVL